METKHTPGPWYVETLDGPRLDLPRGPIHQVLATIGKYPSTVCTVEEYSEVPGFDANRLADARLIAAAPDLLALVLEMFAESEKGMAMLGMPMLSANWHNKAKTVIASMTPNAEVTGRASAACEGPR